MPKRPRRPEPEALNGERNVVVSIKMSHALRKRLRTFWAKDDADRQFQEILAEAIDEYLTKRGG